MMQKRETAIPRSAPLIFGLGYAGLIALSTLRGYFHLVELPWFVTQFAYAAIIGMAGVWVFYSGETRRLTVSTNVMLMQMLPNLLILVWSAALWIYREEPLSLILRGSSMTLYQLLLLAMLIGAGILFGPDAIEWTSLGFIGANTLILLDVMRRNGVGTTIGSMISFLLSVGSRDNAISVQLEVQDVTFGIAILLLYYLIAGKNKPRRLFHIAALTFYFFLGFKRILFPALGLGGAYFLLMERMRPKAQRSVTIAAGLLLIAVSLGYVILIRTGLWFEICDRFGIDLMGRKRLYSYMESYYDVSPAYLGMGSGMVSTVLEVLEKTGNRRLHSDVLRLYVELGMPAFLAWCGLTFIYTYTHLFKRYSPRVGAVYMAITLLMFVTFLTDNTLEKYCPEIAWHLLPLAMALEEREQMIAALHRQPLLSTERTNACSEKESPPLKAAEKAPGKPGPKNEAVEALRSFRTQKWKNRL